MAFLALAFLALLCLATGALSSGLDPDAASRMRSKVQRAYVMALHGTYCIAYHVLLA